MSSSRPLAIATFLVSVAACHAHAPTTALTPPLAPFRPEIHALALGVDSVQLAVRAVLRNPFSDTLTLATTCGGVALRLEYADGVRGRPAIGGLQTRSCLLMYTELRVSPGDSATLTDVIAGVRAERALGVRWLAPIPARYRITTTASRCVRHTRRDCWVTLASAPFEVGDPTARGGGS